MTIYLDNAATSGPKPEAVYRAVDDFMRDVGATPGRGGHRREEEALRIADEARQARRSGTAQALRVMGFGSESPPQNRREHREISAFSASLR